MPQSNNPASILNRVDIKTIATFLALMLLGWVNIFAAMYNPDTGITLSINQRPTMQLIWIGISLVVAIVILLLDDIYYHIAAYPFYGLMFVVLVATLFLAPEIKGAHSWLVLGPVSIQPSEFMKMATALALARYMSEYNFSFRNPKDLLVVGAIVLLPIAVILLQNDTGSALVYGSFFFVFYREGLNKWVFYILGLVIGLFVFSFLLTPTALLSLVILLCVVDWVIHQIESDGVINYGCLRTAAVFVAAIALSTLALYIAFNYIFTVGLSIYIALLVSAIGSIVWLVVRSIRTQTNTLYKYIGIFLGSLLFIFSVDMVFDHLQLHQQKRIYDLLGIESDLQGWGYNVNQSKIAIGSGGLTGKGFLQGTQTQYDFVPEQSTDFIFCTVGEEWGFLGSVVVLALFMILIIRLMRMGERQQEPFRRVYCYSVAGIFLFHVMVNIGMTIGLMPVIGIPLPLFSYGGSSLLAFTMLFFVAVKLDIKRV